MKPKLFIISLITILAFSTSCDNLGLDGGPLSSRIDMSKSNLFDKALICNSWVPVKFVAETYYDGILSKSQEYNGGTNWYIFRKDGTMVYGGTNGTWEYSHNYIIYQSPGNCMEFEVVAVTKDQLVVRYEETPCGGSNFIPFFKDPSGEHIFNVLTFKAE